MGDELVRCHSGYAYAQRPLAVLWQGDWLAVQQVEADWHTPQGKRFLVTVRDGRRFELMYYQALDRWQIQLEC